MPRAAAGAQSIPPRIMQNAMCPKFFKTMRSLQLLLEERFLPPAVNIVWGRYDAAVGDALSVVACWWLNP
jgi:hypothetical protein